MSSHTASQRYFSTRGGSNGLSFEDVAFKDVALQFLGNLFEYFLVRSNNGKSSKDRSHLTVIGATSGDTGSAAIYGLRGKQDVSVFIMYPTGKVSAIQEAQVCCPSPLTSNNGTFTKSKDFVKALFADPLINETQSLAAVNSLPSGQCGNFGDVLAGFFAKKLGVPSESLVIATNENDILHRFWQNGAYEKNPVHGPAAEGGFVDDGAKAHPSGVKETLSPAMDILVSSNFERLLWYLAYTTQTPHEAPTHEKRQTACSKVQEWQSQLKSQGGFSVDEKVLEAAKADFSSERVSDTQTVATIQDVYRKGGYVLDPHSAIGVTAALRVAEMKPGCIVWRWRRRIRLSSNAVELALKDDKGFDFQAILPEQFVGLAELPKRIKYVKKSEGLDGLRKLIVGEVEKGLH
ncbi:hypothetical protein G7Y79_00022g052760 [Physcia stellaris]|nr:hypothetical protein G7Y79_00022g052760 [Physcia stellaris]